jgi:peptidyl-prolyl cis-trans isomerase D
MRAQKLIAKVLTVLLFGVLILSFAIWGIGDMFRTGGQARGVAEVGDTLIDQNSYARELSREVRRLSQQFGAQLDQNQVRLLGIDRQVLRNLVGRALIDSEAGRQGLVVTEAQIKTQIASEAAFKDQFGAFDAARFVQFLNSAGLSEQGFIARLSGEILSQRIGSSISGAVNAPKPLARSVFAYEQERRIASYLRLPTVSEDSLGEASEDELNEFYDRNAETFMAPEFRAVSLIYLRPEDLAGEVAVAEEDLRAEFDRRKNEFAVRERREIEQAVFANEADAQAAHERVVAGEDLAAVAEEISGQMPVSLGATDGSDLLPVLRDAAFATELGAISPPVESALGWHIVRVNGVEPGQEPDFQSLKERLREEIATREAVDALVAMANALDDELGGGASLDGAADTLGLSLTRIAAIDAQGLDRNGEAIAELPALELFLPQAFETPLGETGLLQDTDEGGFFIVRIDGAEEAKQRPLDEVRDEVLRLWRRSQVALLTSEKGDALVDEFESGKSLDNLAAENGLSVEVSPPMTRNENDPAITPSPRFSAALFQIDEGEVVGLPLGEGYIVARLDDVIPADASSDSAAFEATELALTQSIKADFFDLYMSALESEHRVQVNQPILDEVLNSF